MVTSRFFDHSDGGASYARAVLVDMESKVIQNSLAEAKRGGNWLYNERSVYYGKKGSGNNWANGYYQHGQRIQQDIADTIRREVEACDNLDGFLVLMSVAGGTGSGLGTFITELLRDGYPRASILNPVIWPYLSGDVIVQNYNALLTMAHLSEASDAVILLQNDQLHKVCSKLLLLKEISFADLNKVASHVLAGVLQPAVPLESYRTSGRTDYGLHHCMLSDLCAHLTPHPSYPLLDVKCVPQMPEQSHAYTRYLWPGLLKYLRQMCITDSPVEEGMDWSTHETPSQADTSRTTSSSLCECTTRTKVAIRPSKLNKSLANLVVVRGKELEEVDVRGFADDSLYCHWVPRSLRCKAWCSWHQLNRYEKSCSIVANSQSCLRPLNTVVEKAWRMYAARAYMHQYAQFGLNEDLFMEGFVKVEQLIKNYSDIK